MYSKIISRISMIKKMDDGTKLFKDKILFLSNNKDFKDDPNSAGEIELLKKLIVDWESIKEEQKKQDT